MPNFGGFRLRDADQTEVHCQSDSESLDQIYLAFAKKRERIDSSRDHALWGYLPP
jgi:hypothetical protein